MVRQPVMPLTIIPSDERDLHFRRNGFLVLQQIPGVLERGAQDDRRREKKGEARGGGTVQIAEQSGGDGDAAAGNAGNDRQHLRESDGERVRPDTWPRFFCPRPARSAHHMKIPIRIALAPMIGSVRNVESAAF